MSGQMKMRRLKVMTVTIEGVILISQGMRIKRKMKHGTQECCKESLDCQLRPLKVN